VKAASSVTTWLVRFIDAAGVFQSRTFQNEDAARLFIDRLRRDLAQEFRSWAKVETRDLPDPRLSG
jgi:hypothetical protein